ncbi:MAG: acyl-CoA dehydrogenase family protein, partial [Dehalococcoidia bacterium]
MNWSDTPEQSQFRNDVRAFIKDRFPPSYRPNTRSEESLEPEDVVGYNWPADRTSGDPERREGAIAWANAVVERGWVAPHWPKEYGGAGMTPWEQFILYEEFARAGVPMVGGIGVTLLGPALIEYGTEEQRREHLPKILSGNVVWAQGFSETNSGSDLASLKTRAIQEGDHYVVNGQKTWTSHANYADWLFALVRTDLDAPKHKGLSFLLMDIQTPGITVRPIEDMRGDIPFNEVFFEDVQVPVANRVGEENRGWYVAMATLDFERSGIGGSVSYMKALDGLVEFIRDAEDRRALRNDWKESVRLEIADRYIETQVLYNLALRTVSQQAAGEIPNYEASVNQLFASELHQRLAQTCMKAFGLYGNM